MLVVGKKAGRRKELLLKKKEALALLKGIKVEKCLSGTRRHASARKKSGIGSGKEVLFIITFGI